MRRVNQHNSKGQALVVVVAVLVMLFIITMAFFTLSQTERTAAIRHLDSLRAQYIAEAGIVYGQKVLESDKQANLIDTLEDLTFKNFEGEDADLDGDGTNESKWFSFSDSEGKAFGRFAVKISDEASRLNLNSASVEALSRLFSQFGIDPGKANQVVARRPFNAKEEASSVLGQDDFVKVKDCLTIYSRDLEYDLNKKRRIYLNTSQPQLILEAFLDAGIKNCYEKTANLKDASDADLNQTFLDKFSNIFIPSGLAEPGGWYKVMGYYEANSSNDAPGKFTWTNLAVEDGEYHCFLFGYYSGDVVAGDPPLLTGEGLKDPVKVEGGNLTVTIKPAKGTTSRFTHIELVSSTPRTGLNRRVVTGTEALVINELMVKPSKEILIDPPLEIAAGQNKEWTFSQIDPGYYYVVVEALTPGGLVGDVTISGQVGQNLRDQDYFPRVVSVDVKGEINVKIKNNSLGASNFKGIKILQEPDTEWIEILNLSPDRIDLSDFSLEAYTSSGELVPGWPARIPANTSIDSYQHLVLAVDNNDGSGAPSNLQGNRISFYGVYNANAVGLIFDEATSTINKENDLLANSGGRIILKDSLGERIDAIEYQGSQVRDFTSIERADPSRKTASDDSNGNGFFEGWHQSSSVDLCTPGLSNDNPGMYLMDSSGKLVKQSIGQVIVFNRPLVDLSEVVQLSSGLAWEKFSVSDLALMADHFAYDIIDLDMAGHEQDAGSGIWEFTNVAQGNYLLSIVSNDPKVQGKEIQVAIKTSVSSDFTDLQPLLFVRGFAFYGTVNLPESSSTLQVKVVTDTPETKNGLQKIWLEPVYFVSGRVNVNTAKQEVLNSLLLSSGLVNTVIQDRPVGDKGERLLGIGELFLLSSDFVTYNKYLTVKSDVYEIYSRGDYMQLDKTVAYQTIRSTLERAN